MCEITHTIAYQPYHSNLLTYLGVAYYVLVVRDHNGDEVARDIYTEVPITVPTLSVSTSHSL